MFRYHYNKVRRSNKTGCPSGISSQVRRFAIALAREMLPHRPRTLHYGAGGLIHQRSRIAIYSARALIHQRLQNPRQKRFMFSHWHWR